MSSRCPEPTARRARRTALVLALAALVAGGCEREKREFARPGPGLELSDKDMAEVMVARYERNAYALASGKRLFGWYNCTGCHANGGGGSGPALTDETWIYGGDGRSIVQTIVEGRPNGMPAFGGRIPIDQIWQLAAFVRSTAGLAPVDAAPNRDDAFLTREPEAFRDPQKPPPVKPTQRTGRPL
jgi:cytochrome c oxidase cbb3-type subunit 3